VRVPSAGGEVSKARRTGTAERRRGPEPETGSGPRETRRSRRLVQVDLEPHRRHAERALVVRHRERLEIVAQIVGVGITPGPDALARLIECKGQGEGPLELEGRAVIAVHR